MTVTGHKAMRRSKRGLWSALLATAALLLMVPATPADENPPRKVHVIDSNTDRTPSVTAFPAYPRIARRDRIEGEATVCFLIDKFGKIRRPRIKHASHPIFKRAAMRAIRESTFEPLAPHEILATARTCRTYRFRLQPVAVAES